MQSRSLHGLGRAIGVLLYCLVISACNHRQPTQTVVESPQDRAWDAMKPLPDWSGTWASTAESVNHAIADCCQGKGEAIPFTAKYKTLRAALGEREQKNPGGSNLNNVAHCMPAGMPGILSHPVLFEYLFTPGRVTMLFDDTEVRRIYTDGSPHAPTDEDEESFSGHSIGHWEGKVLVVDTIDIAPRADFFMSNGIHVTKDTHVVERMFLNPQGLLQIDSTVTDPEVFAQPYVYTRTFQKVTGSFEPGCAQNNRDNGNDPVDLTPP